MRWKAAAVAAVAAAVAVATSAAPARAHELQCIKTVSLEEIVWPVAAAKTQPIGSPEVVINQYPATVLYTVVIYNPLTSGKSTIQTAKDLTADLDFGFSTPYDLDPGQYVEGYATVTFNDRDECLAFGNQPDNTPQPTSSPTPRWLLPPPVCEWRDNVFQVTFDGGLAQCRARVVCGQEVPE